MDLRQEQVVVETDRHRIEGSLTLSTGGSRSRLSDYLNQRDREFLVLQDALIRPVGSEGGVRQEPVILVARRHVRFVAPVDARGEQGS
jgi:hypothetical protein